MTKWIRAGSCLRRRKSNAGFASSKSSRRVVVGTSLRAAAATRCGSLAGAARAPRAGCASSGAGVGWVLKLLRWVDDWAYLISVPFVVLMIFGLVVENRSFVHLGAVVVVLANYGRFWADLLAFFVRPTRTARLHGLAFLFPPYTVYYLTTRWGKMKPISPADRHLVHSDRLGRAGLRFSPLRQPVGQRRRGLRAQGQSRCSRDRDGNPVRPGETRRRDPAGQTDRKVTAYEERVRIS